MHCPVCGGDNREGARFCRHCGAQLAEQAATGTSVAAASSEWTDEGSTAATVMSEPESEEPVPERQDVETGMEATVEVEAGAEVEEEIVAETTAEELDVAAGPQEMAAEAQPEGIGAAPVPEPTVGEAERQEVEVPVPPEWTAEQQAPDAEMPPETEAKMTAFWRERAEPLVAATPGTVIADRYLVVEVLEVQEKGILYQARDLKRCWQCGYSDNSADEAFCAQCGASLDRKPTVRLLEVQDADAQAPFGEVVAARLDQEGRTFLLLAEPESEAHPATGSIRLVVGQRSDVGLERELDEDSLLVLTVGATYESRTGPVLGLFAVADGMGGHESGEVASKLALQVLADRVLRGIVLFELAATPVPDEEIGGHLERATAAANDAVYLARQKRENDMGTTLTTVFIRDDRLFLAHVGDCRAYRWNADGLRQLTTDHSVVASMIASGRAEPEEIYTHPQRSIIYRSIGDKPAVEVDTDALDLEAGDRIIVCCDGLWEMVRNEGIADVMMQEADPQLACDLLIKRANTAGGEDNISVIVVQVEPV
jgi:serine/threonine protein phosphatase PrpC